jgi:hypothetical protein
MEPHEIAYEPKLRHWDDDKLWRERRWSHLLRQDKK